MKKSHKNRILGLFSRITVFVMVFVSLHIYPPILRPTSVKAATLSIASIDFDAADESDFTQEDATNGTDFDSGVIKMAGEQAYGGVSTATTEVSSTAYSTVDEGFTVPTTGAIKKWRVATYNTASTLKLKVYLNNSLNNFTLRGESSGESTTANSVNGPFTTDIDVTAGDMIGLQGTRNPFINTGCTGSESFRWNSGDFTGTGGFGNSNTSYCHENLEITLADYPTSQAYYITTKDASQLDVGHWTAVNSVSFTQSTPTNTSIKYLISFDGRNSWKYWTGSAWASSILADLQTNGNSKATLEALSSANWGSAGGFTAGTTEYIDFAIDLKTTNNTDTATVDLISFSYEAPADQTLDFDLADESDFIQEDATNGTDFSSGVVQLAGTSGTTGGVTAVTNVISAGSFSTIDESLTLPEATTITSWRVYAAQSTSLKLKIYKKNSANNYTLRGESSSESVTGGQVNGSFSTSINVQSGDMIGLFGAKNPYKASGTSGNTFRWTGSDFSGTGSFSSSSTVHQHPNIEVSYSSLPTSQAYYLTTSDTNQIDVSAWTRLSRITFTQTTVSGTSDIKYLVSFDGRVTWKYWNGSSWASSSLANLQTDGMSKSTIESLKFNNWAGTGGFNSSSTTKLDFAMDFSTSSGTINPSLDQISVEYTTDEIGSPIVAVNTTSNKATVGRHKAGSATTFDLTFTMSNTLSSDLTVTFPSTFTITGAFTSGTCASGTIGSFAFDNSAKTLTASKSTCSGLVTLSGANITLPSSTGQYQITWTNDDPGSTTIPVTDDDQVSITASVAETMTFDIDGSTADGAVNSGGDDNTAPYIVTFGNVTTTDTRTSGTTDSINHIYLDIDTNASSGAVIQVKNANGTNGLVSASVPGDNIGSADGTIADGTENYGICIEDLAVGTTVMTGVAPYVSTCATNSETNTVGGLLSTFHNLASNTSAIDSARIEISFSAAISTTTAAHDDYIDTITFRATATF